VTAMVTPFDAEGRLDLEKAQELARWLCDNGSDGLVVAGSTGESTALEDHEKLELFAAVVDAVSVPVLAGVGTASTGHTLALIEKSASIGLAGYLLVTPYYCRPSQAGIKEHFKACAEAAGDRPVLLYDIPARTGRRIARQVMLELHEECPNVVGVKDASGDPAATAALVSEAPEGFVVYAGDDALAFLTVAHGGAGVVSVASHWAGREFREMLDCVEAGRLERARELYRRMLPSFRFESSESAPNPLPAKAMLRVIGIDAGYCRPPLGRWDPSLEQEARKVLASLGRS
jgi:4-hydroxy-tetrahydrodipicolinate synthase